MPLIKGKSKASFGKNVETEMHEGKSQPQSLAIAYSMKRKAEHKARGGMCAHGAMAHCAHGCHMAEGGMLTNSGYESSGHEHLTHPNLGHNEQREYDSEEFNKKHPMHHDEMAMREDERKLNQHGEIEEGPQHPRMSEGGMLTDDGYQDDSHEMDMVGRIMAQRQKMFSKGGKVANDTPITAGFKENDFDDLALRDDLEYENTGENSGDFDARHPHVDEPDADDLIDRIMRRRMSKNPKVLTNQVRTG